VLWAWSAAETTSCTERSYSRSFSCSTRTWYSGSSPPITETWATPGMASSLFRRSNSAYDRSSIGRTLPSGDDTASSMISPVIDVIGVISACASGGRSSRIVSSRSETSWRAR
jgi:hypothetical protein